MADPLPSYSDSYDGDGRAFDDSITGSQVVKNKLTLTIDEVFATELDILATIEQRLNQVQQVWSNNYLPCELGTLATVSAVAKQYIDTTTTAGTASAETVKAYAQATSTIKADLAAMCMTECGIDSRIAVARARSESWKVQGSLRYEETRIETENAIRLNDRMRMISPGRNGVVAAANSLMAAARMRAEQAAQAAASQGDSGYLRGRLMQEVGNMAKTYAKEFAKAGPEAAPEYTNTFAGEAEAYLNQPIGQAATPNDATWGSVESGYTNTFEYDAQVYQATPTVDAGTL